MVIRNWVRWGGGRTELRRVPLLWTKSRHGGGMSAIKVSFTAPTDILKDVSDPLNYDDRMEPTGQEIRDSSYTSSKPHI